MYNPNVMQPSVYKEKSVYGKKYLPAFLNVHGKLMFVSHKCFKTRTLAQTRADAIWARWRQAYQDTMNCMLEQTHNDAAVVVRAPHIP